MRICKEHFLLKQMNNEAPEIKCYDRIYLSNIGFSGPRGDLGFPGVKGSVGNPGVPGIPGRYGSKGEKGTHGEVLGALTGQTGEPGLPGLQGEKGPSGEPGSPGYAGQCVPRFSLTMNKVSFIQYLYSTTFSRNGWHARYDWVQG